jgi:hypothetical protein
LSEFFILLPTTLIPVGGEGIIHRSTALVSNNTTTMSFRPTATFDSTVVEGTLSGYILSFVEYIDTNFGATEWSGRQVALATVLVLGVLRATCKEAYGVSWYTLAHAAVSGYFSAMAVWLSVFAAVPLTDVPEPRRSILCQGPLTSLHRILPAITTGFGLFDMMDAHGHGLDFVRRQMGNEHSLFHWLLLTIFNLILLDFISTADTRCGDFCYHGIFL